MSGKKRILLLFFIPLVLGPKIILLAPIWITGVIIYKWKILQSISIKCSIALLFASTLGIYYFHEFNVSELFENLLKSWIGNEMHKQLTFSKFFIGDYVYTLFIFMNFVSMRILSPFISSLISILEKPIKFFSSFTFSIYLFHQPFILFYAALLNLDPNGYRFYSLTIFLVFLSVFVIGYLIERRRYKLRNFLNTYLSSFANSKKTKAVY